MLSRLILVLQLCSGVLGACPYPQSLSIIAPKTLEALSGTCLLVPCRFTPHPNFRISKPITGIWGKNHPFFHKASNLVVFNSSDHSNRYYMNITGDLSQQNCTTVFYNVITDYTEQYFIRIESKGFQANAACDPLKITVKESPWSPSVLTSGQQKDREVLTLTCSAVTPCPHAPPTLTLTLTQQHPPVAIDTQHPPVTMETNRDMTITVRIQHSITLSEQHDGVKITCSAAYPVNGGHKTAESSITLNVTYSPKHTSVSVSPSQSVTEGQLVNMSCSSKANPPIDLYTWYKVTSEGPVSVYEGHFYSFIFNKTTQGQYYCEAINDAGKNNSSMIHLQLEGSSVAETLKAVVGGSIGLLILICLLVSVWCFLFKRRGPTESNMRCPANTVTEQEVVPPYDTDRPRRTLEADKSAEDSLHYEEINFSKLRPKVCTSSEQEETVYSHVKVNRPAPDNSDDLYANIKR